MDDTGLPLLPRGDAIFERLPSRALILEAVAPAVDEGLIHVDDGEQQGVVMVRESRIAETFAFEPRGRRSGDAAMQRIHAWADAHVSAWRLPHAAMEVLPLLARSTPCYKDLRLEWTSWHGLLADLRARGELFSVQIDTAAGRGVTCIKQGRHVATFSESHRELGKLSLLDELAAAREGSITVCMQGDAVDAADDIPTQREAADALTSFISRAAGENAEEELITAAYAFHEDHGEISDGWHGPVREIRGAARLRWLRVNRTER